MTPIPVLPPTPPLALVPASPSGEVAMRDAAQKLEATFLAEMLKAAGFDRQMVSFGGGIGEEQFSSFLLQAQADEMAKAGGIGLAESLFNAMRSRLDE